MPRRSPLRVELTEDAIQRLRALSDKHGMTQIQILSRLAELFATQDPLIQAEMIDRYQKTIKPDIATLIRKKRSW